MRTRSSSTQRIGEVDGYLWQPGREVLVQLERGHGTNTGLFRPSGDIADCTRLLPDGMDLAAQAAVQIRSTSDFLLFQSFGASNEVEQPSRYQRVHKCLVIIGIKWVKARALQSRFYCSPRAIRLALTQHTHHEHRRYIVIYEAIARSVFSVPTVREGPAVRLTSSFACRSSILVTIRSRR